MFTFSRGKYFFQNPKLCPDAYSKHINPCPHIFAFLGSGPKGCTYIPRIPHPPHVFPYERGRLPPKDFIGHQGTNDHYCFLQSVI